MPVEIVAEESLATLLDADLPMHRVGRLRSRGRWRDITADAVLDAFEAAGPRALVLARPAAADAGAVAVPSLARTTGREVVRLPGDRVSAAWTVAIGARVAHDDRAGLVRALQVLAGIGGGPPTHLRDGSLNPTLLVRWSRRAWRPCGRCTGGGLPGCSCGRCGTLLGAVAGAAA